MNETDIHMIRAKYRIPDNFELAHLVEGIEAEFHLTDSFGYIHQAIVVDFIKEKARLIQVGFAESEPWPINCA